VTGAESRLGGLTAALVGGLLTSTSPRVLALAGSGTAFGSSMGWGAALLLAYGIGHCALLALAGLWSMVQGLGILG